MGVLNITDQVGWKRALRVPSVAQSICWDRAALVRNILRSILQRCGFIFSSSVGAFAQAKFRKVAFHWGIFSDAPTALRLSARACSGDRAREQRRLAVAARLADVSREMRPCRPLLGSGYLLEVNVKNQTNECKCTKMHVMFARKNIDDYYNFRRLLHSVTEISASS